MLRGLAILSFALLASAFWRNPAAVWISAVCVALFPVGLMALGATRERKGLGATRIPLVLLGIALAGGLLTLLALPHGGPDAGALPLGTVLMLFFLVPVPFVLACWTFIATFDGWLRDEDLERLRGMRKTGPSDGTD